LGAWIDKLEKEAEAAKKSAEESSKAA